MKIVIASDSFKGSLSSMDVACAAEKGIKNILPDCEVIKVDVADGGEGTTEALTSTLGGEMVEITAHDPLMRPIKVRYGIIGETAVLEMAAASGLPLLSPSERNPMITTTFGTGEMILDAVSRGCRKFLVGIGGSATNDAGTGMMQALGAIFTETNGQELNGCGQNLGRIAKIDLSGVAEKVRTAEFIVACDVDTPFCGPRGAAYTFAPQKGASPGQVEELDRGMKAFADVLRTETGLDIRELPGSGAAGGLGGGFRAMLGARLEKGIEMVLDAIGFDGIISDADLVITGEGKIDFQTPKGKTACGVLGRAKKQNIPVVAIGGCVEECREVSEMGFIEIQAISTNLPLEMAMNPAIAAKNVEKTAEKLAKKMK